LGYDPDTNTYITCQENRKKGGGLMTKKSYKKSPKMKKEKATMPSKNAPSEKKIFRLL